ncbi:PH domain-containing protein [Patescibacteria group bacterium]|nr:PH domain-containing protein [Patescibacteria group bacterium]MBU0776686.1 PH domain-containing protein [Patescibacteria group bacterium]MBU0846130.1 PH domain-containing protein [Patescibacteria group bacterium]MBU0922781.1 PH domain-containing protein [Patescibacteria group bacterium]MBU1066298.1 PH domain-containing protein [Patescibacteria group bacterium]
MPDIFISNDTKKEKLTSKKEPIKKKSASKAKREGKHRRPKYKLEQKAQGRLSAFSYLPKKVNFETRDKEEKVVLLLRRHPVTNFSWIVIGALMIVAPAVLSIFPLLSFLPDEFQLIAILGWYLITTAFFMENFLTWFFNVNIITDERIIDIDFFNLIYKQVSDTNIDKIQDVTYTMGGVARTLFNYGDVFVQTAAEVPNFDFLAVPNPDKVAKILQDLRIEEEIEKLEGRVR